MIKSDKLLKYHKLLAEGKTGDAALLMAVEFESGEWLADEPHNDNYISRMKLENKKKDGIEIAQKYYVQALAECVEVNKLRALIGLFRCKHGDLLYDYPEIAQTPRLKRETVVFEKLLERWSPSFRLRIQRLKERSCGAVLFLEALAADLGLECTIPSADIEAMYESAVRKGSSSACFQLATRKLRGGDNLNGERLLRIGVNRGSVESYWALGELLIRSDKVQEGIDCLVYAASHGSGNAWRAIAVYLTTAHAGTDKINIASCYRFAVRCGCEGAFDWLAENEPVDPTDRYGFRATRQMIVDEFTKRKYEHLLVSCNSDLCYEAYKYMLGLKKHDHPEVMRNALERAALLGNSAAMFELARMLDTEEKMDDACWNRRYRSSEDVCDKDDVLAVMYYRKAAIKGHAKAMRVLGCLYYNGRIVLENKQLAFEWMYKAASLSDAEAQLYLAKMYREGVGCAENAKEAMEWLMKAFHNEHLNECVRERAAWGCWQLGQIMESSSTGVAKWDDILPVYKRSAEKFDSFEAFWRLGEIYESGISGTCSLVFAAEYYCKALFLLKGDGCCNQFRSMFDSLLRVDSSRKDVEKISEQCAYCIVLAYAYDVGFEMLNNDGSTISLECKAESARKWYGLAIELGSATAAWRYGELCEYGIGGPVDLKAAETSYCVAASSKRLAMTKNLANKYLLGVVGGNEHFRHAAIWLQKCIDLGNHESAVPLGKLYLSGSGVVEDVSRAVELFEKSECDEGYCAIAELCLKENNEQRDVFRLLKCLELCNSCRARILQGEICFEQGRRFEYGLGVAKDLLLAIRFYSKASMAKYVKAQVRLSELYEEGCDIIKKNLRQASRWCYWASENGDARSAFRLGVYCELGIVKNEHGMTYIRQLYEKACLGGCKEAESRVKELIQLQQCKEIEASCNPVLVEMEEVGEISDIVKAEKRMEREIISDSLRNLDNSTWSIMIRQSPVLANFVANHHICELDIPKDKFSISFNEVRRKIEQKDDYDDSRNYGEEYYDDSIPRTWEDAYEIYGSKLWDA